MTDQLSGTQTVKQQNTDENFTNRKKDETQTQINQAKNQKKRWNTNTNKSSKKSANKWNNEATCQSIRTA